MGVQHEVMVIINEYKKIGSRIKTSTIFSFACNLYDLYKVYIDISN